MAFGLALNANLHVQCTILDEVWSRQGGVRFHQATAHGQSDIEAVQHAVRQRVLRMCEASLLGLAGNILLLRHFAFERRGVLASEAAAEMRQW